MTVAARHLRWSPSGAALGNLGGSWSRPAAVRAIRAAVVVPSLLAVTFEVIGDPQMATYATFAGFANLVLAAFPGGWYDKLEGHAGLAVVGAALLVLGTAVNGTVAVAGPVTLVVTFAVLLAGGLGPKLAAGGLGVMLAYVLAAASPGTPAMDGSRVEGWLLGTAASALAVLLTSPRRPPAPVPAALAGLAQALAVEIRAVLGGGADLLVHDASLAAQGRLRGAFDAAPSTPTGLAAVDQALGSAVELLEWATDLLGDTSADLTHQEAFGDDDRALLACTADTLDAVAGLMVGAGTEPPLARLEELRQASAAAVRHLAWDHAGFDGAVHASFHARSIAVAVRTAAADALIAGRRASPAAIAVRRAAWLATAPDGATSGTGADAGRASLRNATEVAVSVIRRHASLRSVWTRNAARGSVAVAAAVVVADLSNVQHGFWVVLGTLSVLRTTATSTGGTAMRALLGTTVGVLAGAAVVTAVGTDTTVLWLLLPVAVALAAYAPGVAPFAVGQAAFTALLVVLYNLLVPTGWRVGVVRVEDIALGCAISLVVGVLLWPRGAGTVVAADLDEAFVTSGQYLVHAVDWALGAAPSRPEIGRAALIAGLRLDDAIRSLLGEQGTSAIDRADLWTLVGATERIRLTAASVAELPPGPVDGAVAGALRDQARSLANWYDAVAVHLGRGRLGTLAPLGPFLDAPSPAGGAWRVCATYVEQHLRHLHRHHHEVIDPALSLGVAARRPWWHPAPAAEGSAAGGSAAATVTGAPGAADARVEGTHP